MPIFKNAGLSLLAGLTLLLAACGPAPEAEEAKLSPLPSGKALATALSSPSPALPAGEPSAAPQTPAAPTEAVPAQTPSAGNGAPGGEEGLPPTAEEAAATVVRALKNGDMQQLAAWVHPEKGLRFSPYAYVDTGTDLVLTREEMETAMGDPAVRIWGSYAGSGEPIKLAFSGYYKQFVYDADFAGKAKVSVNQSLGQGTTVNNLSEVYPSGSYDFVEYYIAGIDPSAQGMDWRSLRLVFERIGQDHALVGMVHDQWTP